VKIVIFGNGAMARVVFSHVRPSMAVAGFCVDDEFCHTEQFCGLPLLPFSRVEADFAPRNHLMLSAIGFREMNRLRERKRAEALAKGYGFARYIHPSVMRHDDVEVAEDCVVLEHCAIHPGSRIGVGSFLASNVNLGHDCRIGEHNWINAGVSLAGGVEVGARGFFGVNASVTQGVRIGTACFIGANTLVNRQVADGEVHLAPAGERFRLNSDDFLTFSRQ